MLQTLRDVASILRVHIIAIAVAAAVVFGSLLTGRHGLDVALIGGLDWLLINLLNRVTDLKEDLLNGIRGTERIARRPRLALGLWLAVFAGSFALSHALHPELTPWRALVQLVGVGYSYRIVPTPRGLRRFKDLYFFKNFMSAMLFVATVFAYPIVAADGLHATSGLAPTPLTVGALVIFFVAFEITYEILYDMRDLEGDRAASVPTYPVVHGLDGAAAIINGLLFGASAVLVSAFALGLVGVRELLMVAAPAIQYAFYRKRYVEGRLTTAACIGVTWLGAGLLLFWLLGTWLWAEAGLPANVFVGPLAT
jgi:4-hydroxybenzoate polyprenyltransferase